MRFANCDNRLTLLTYGGEPSDGVELRGIDVSRGSGGTLPHQPEAALERWDAVIEWAARITTGDDSPIDVASIASPSPRPRQIFGIGINYADHGAEAGMERPEVPLVFTKLSPAIAGPFDSIQLTTQTVDWEVEVAVVIGRTVRAATIEEAWGSVAGLTVGQDLSDRDIQWRPKASPQFSVGKSLPGFGPLGPLLVTPDEFKDPDDIELACRLNGDEVQRSRTSSMLFSVPELIAYLSSLTTLLPGDVIFTGTPAGIGMTRTPPRYLKPGDRLDSWVEGIGTMSHVFTGGTSKDANTIIDNV
jgi:2,4-didehydro-3-deoxy-L-rhamnonate hydrolase